jgi:hypothetical protein
MASTWINQEAGLAIANTGCLADDHESCFCLIDKEIEFASPVWDIFQSCSIRLRRQHLGVGSLFRPPRYFARWGEISVA